MNNFGLISIGLLLGLVVTALLLAIAALIYLTWRQRAEIVSARATMTEAITVNSAATDKLRTELTFLLQQVDAERMYQASLGLQRSARQLVTTVNLLHKLVYDSQREAAPIVDEMTETMDAAEAATAGDADVADRLAAEQWQARPRRSWPPSTGMGMQPAASAPAAAAPEPLPPVHPLPDIGKAYEEDIQHDLPGDFA